MWFSSLLRCFISGLTQQCSGHAYIFNSDGEGEIRVVTRLFVGTHMWGGIDHGIDTHTIGPSYNGHTGRHRFALHVTSSDIIKSLMDEDKLKTFWSLVIVKVWVCLLGRCHDQRLLCQYLVSNPTGRTRDGGKQLNMVTHIYFQYVLMQPRFNNVFVYRTQLDQISSQCTN